MLPPKGPLPGVMMHPAQKQGHDADGDSRPNLQRADQNIPQLLTMSKAGKCRTLGGPTLLAGDQLRRSIQSPFNGNRVDGWPLNRVGRRLQVDDPRRSAGAVRLIRASGRPTLVQPLWSASRVMDSFANRYPSHRLLSHFRLRGGR
jgi:hypothetical protein